MNKILQTGFVLLAFIVSMATAKSNEPPPAKTLEQRVELSTLIVVGTAKSVAVIEEKNGEIQRVEPQPEIVDASGQITQVEIEVDEVLYASNWKPTPIVKYLFGDGFFELESIRKDTLGKKQIYLMKPYEYTDHAGYFLPSWDWHLAESLEEKSKIEAWIQQREQREKAEQKPAVISWKDLEINDAKRARVIPIRVYLPAAPIDAATPVVLFSHGLGGTREAATYLGQYWAAHGYVAVFMQHAGSDDGVWKNVPFRQRMANMKKAGNLENFLLRVGDVAAVLDQLEIWNKGAQSPFFGRMNMTKIGMAGHSFGALTTQAVSGQTANFGAGFADKRIKAALILSPSAPAKGDAKTAFGSVKIPWLLMTGTLDKSELREFDADARLKVFPALPADRQKYQLILDKAEHSAFVDARMARDVEPHNPNHHRAIEAISTAFWDAYLKDDAKAKQWIDGDKVRDVLEVADVWQTK